MYLSLKCNVEGGFQNTNFKIINQHRNDTCHVQSLEKDFYIGAPCSFDHVFTLICLLCGVGVNVSHKLHCHVVVAIPSFSRPTYVCKKKYMTFLKNYKAEKIINEVFGNSQHGRKFYEVMDHWNHHKGQFIKVVSTSTTSSKTFDINNQDDEENFEEGTMITLDFIKKMKKMF
jgi:hypothetical protein